MQKKNIFFLGLFDKNSFSFKTKLSKQVSRKHIQKSFIHSSMNWIKNLWFNPNTQKYITKRIMRNKWLSPVEAW